MTYADQQRYMSLQGMLFAAERDSSGNKKNLIWLGNFPSFQITTEFDEEVHRESWTGTRGKDLILTKSKDLSFEGECESWNVKSLALGLHSESVDVAAGTVTAETLPNTVAAGDVVTTQNPKISNLVINDSAGTPAQLTEDTHYRIDNADFGRIEFIDVAGFTQPFTANYSYGDRVDLGLFNKPAPERWIEFHGINTARNNEKVMIALYRARISPLSELATISDELASFSLSGDCLVDSTKPVDGTFGQFGYYKELG